MMKNRVTILAIFIILLLSNRVSFSADKSQIESSIQEAGIEIKEKQLLAESILKKANKSFFDKKYKEAADLYLKSISVLSNLPEETDVEKKINNIRDSLAYTYASWSESLISDAKTTANQGKTEEARKLALKAREINPEIKPETDKILKKISQIEDEEKFEQLSEDQVSSKRNKEKEYNISVLYEQGKTLFKQNDINKAKEKFQAILLMDPYNNRAIHYLDIINRKVYNTGVTRKDQTSAARTAQVTWESMSPIKDRNMRSRRIDIGLNKPIKKNKENTTDLIDNLDNIIIPHIAFEGVPVMDALTFLNEEAKKLDPKGKGINFILRLSRPTPPGNNNNNNSSNNNPDAYTIDYVMDMVPLKKAIEDICDKGRVYYKFDKYAVIISSTPIGGRDLETKVFLVDKTNFGTFLISSSQSTIPAQDMRPFFAQRGVNLSGDEKAVFDFRINRLIVRTIPEKIKEITKIIEKIESTLNPMVSISSKFIEIEQNDFEELGFEWNVSMINGHLTAPSEETVPFLRDAYMPLLMKNNPAGTPDREFGFTITKDNNYINGVIHALNQTGKTETLSSPKITTMNGCTTTIRVVRERYFPDSWSEPKIVQLAGNNTNQQWVVSAIPNFAPPTELGIVFRVTPFIGSDNYTIDLILEPLIQAFKEFNDEYSYFVSVDDETDTSGGNNGTRKYVRFDRPVPVISTRSIKTRLRIYDGDTVVMGGALVDETQIINDQIPILGDIPLLGRAFQSKIDQAIKKNLLIFTRVNLVLPDGTLLRPAKNGGQATFLDTF